MALTLNVHQQSALYCIKVKPCQTYNRNVHTYASKEAPSSTESVYIPIDNSHNNNEEVSKREGEKNTYMCSRKKKRSFNLWTRCYWYYCCYSIYAVPWEKESEREEKRTKASKRNMQLYLLQFITRESRVLIPINCSVHEMQENYADTRAV